MRVIPPRVVKPSIPHGLDAICMRALAHDPRERYVGMQQMIDALVEERFSNGFREGASDLAAAIREVATGVPALQQPRTMVTDRPVTIATRSLIKELTPVRRSSPSVSNSIPRVQDSGARTNNILTEDILRAAALLELPASLRADGTPMPPFRMPDGSMPSNDLASVVGGHTMAGAQAGAAVLVEQRSSRWAFGILGIAAVIGVVAAVAIQLAPSNNTVPAEPAPPLVMPQTPPPTTLDQDLSKVAPSVATTQDPVPAPAPLPPEPTITEATPVVEPDAPVVPEPTPAPTPETNTRKATPRKPVVRSEANQTPGYLRVGMQDGEDPVFGWATVTGGKIGSIKHDTPHKFELPPGRYTVKFKSDEHGRSITRQIVITAGNTTVKTVDFEVDK